jgi:hypothetical protein
LYLTGNTHGPPLPITGIALLYLNLGTVRGEVDYLELGVRHGYSSAIVLMLLLTTNLKSTKI